MNTWLYIVNKKNGDIIRDFSVIGFREKDKGLFEQIRNKDKLIMYVKPLLIYGIYEVANHCINNVKFEGEEYSYQIKIKEKVLLKYPVKIRDNWIKYDLVNELDFLKKIHKMNNPTRWGVLMYGKTLIKLSEHDYKLLKKHINT
jgi:predicted RNA-binding protein